MSDSTSPKRLPEREAFGLALKRLRKRADMTQEAAAEQAGIHTVSWRRYEWGERDLSLEKWSQMAEAVGATRDALLLEFARIRGEAPPAATGGVAETVTPFRQPPVDLAPLPIRDRVQAGAWLSADDTNQVVRTWPVARDPRYPRADQWLSEVSGDSVNQLHIFEGDLVHVVDAEQINYFPKSGDLVEVERLRFGGSLRELSVKEVEVTPGGVLLWPRSTNPRWREPLDLAEGTTDGEEFEVRIRGLVLSAIRRFS